MFYVVLDLIKSSHLFFTLTNDKKLTVFELVAQVFTSILSGSGQVKNFNVKVVLMGQCFKPFVAKSTANDKLTG
jgi:hypothetical protein